MRKLAVFILCAFLPMIGAGLGIHHFKPAEGVTPDMVSLVVISLLTSGAMLLPMLGVIITQLIFKEPLFKGLDISFRFNRWWLIGWLLMPVLAFATLGVTLLMPGAEWTPDSSMMQQALNSFPEGLGVWGFLGITVVSGLLAGATINAIFAFGEEIAWRGYLLKLFEGKKFMTTAFLTGLIWGIWHAPLILTGHNYPQHPVAGVFMMIVFCILFTPILMYFRQKSGSVIVPAIMHGTFNAVAGISLLLVSPANDLFYGATGLAGMIVLLVVDMILVLNIKQ